MSKQETKLIKFKLSPTGRFALAYNEGEAAELEAKQAAELVDAGYADYVDAEGNVLSGGDDAAGVDALKADIDTLKKENDTLKAKNDQLVKRIDELLKKPDAATNAPDKEAKAAAAKAKPEGENAADKGAASAEKA